MDRQPKAGPTTPHPDPLALSRVPAKSAGEACAATKLPGPALALLQEEHTPRQYLDSLLGAGLFAAAVRFLAFALPAREAVWWACLCVRLTRPGMAVEEEKAANAAARWVVEPTEARRQEAERLARQDTPGGWVAKAVAWTGGSLAPPPAPPVKPRPEMPSHAVAAALAMALNGVAPPRVEVAHRQALALGAHVARGKHLWAATPAGPRRAGGLAN
ncbi:MAG: hypothetical protein U0797_29940 [Gemmataceae bacterium]